MRARFREHLMQGGTTIVQECQVRYLSFGAGRSECDARLKELLLAHGVGKQRVEECASHITQRLSSGVVSQVLESPNPWKDLKTRATQARPPIQIVLEEELRTAVAKRLEQKGQFGSKANKEKGSKTDAKPIRAEQIRVPTGVFTQEGGQPLDQVEVTKLGPQHHGIAVANIENALPFLQGAKPITSEGAAILILETMDARIRPGAQTVRFPAICQETQEPVLLSGALVQLGTKQVGRTPPQHQLKVAEEENLAVRALTYRDELEQAWESFSQGPVKAILALPPCAHLAEKDLLDVWDRQYLDIRFGKASPKGAEVFSVLLRVTAHAAKSLVADSGRSGLYFEPRSENGRQPHAQYKVVWVPRKSKHEVQILQSQLGQSSELVRYGARFGVRLQAAHAEEAHKFLRPEVAYIQGSELIPFKIGPIPFGTTKRSLTELFKEWGWAARPVQPAGQSQDNTGVFWLVHAAQSPSHWIYQLAQGDVLISRETKEKEQVASKFPIVAASKRTMQSLRSAGPELPEDPWLKKDPWSGGAPAAKPAPTTGLSTHQITSLEARVEQKVTHAIESRIPDVPIGEGTHPNARINDLEQKVHTLANSLTQFQAQQGKQNQAVCAELQQVKSQVDAQTASFGATLEKKLAEQMEKLDALLSKRGRFE